ncbi:hypothetical protein IU476_34855 [Nocardia blacklockiae]|nr:hypothetical protein [Nocardia blacklockiae]MBF6176659.1 hypothetical protein [Nocardia blacklockiae]
MGTGDGRAVLAAAAADPRRLVIGVDANAAGMAESSRRAAQPRRGAANALFVAAAVEHPPVELSGVADEVTVYFPWGSLLRGLLTADPAVLTGLTSLMKPQASLEILLSVTEHDALPGIPALDEPHTLAALAVPFAAHGLRLTAIRPAAATEVASAGSSWGKRLGAGTKRPVWHLAARYMRTGERAG